MTSIPSKDWCISSKHCKCLWISTPYRLCYCTLPKEFSNQLPPFWVTLRTLLGTRITWHLKRIHFRCAKYQQINIFLCSVGHKTGTFLSFKILFLQESQKGSNGVDMTHHPYPTDECWCFVVTALWPLNRNGNHDGLGRGLEPIPLNYISEIPLS